MKPLILVLFLMLRVITPTIHIRWLPPWKKERWIAAFHQESGVPLSIGVGASLDFIVGKQVRAPGWLQRIGLDTQVTHGHAALGRLFEEVEAAQECRLARP